MNLSKQSNHTTIIVIAIFVIAAMVGLGSIAQEKKSVESQNSVETSLKQVEPKYVCMVNDQLFKKAQIPVTVEGKTYYGCCEMCKGKLASDPSSRTSIDPVSSKMVDKADSIIGATETGKVYYFENNINLKKFEAKMD